MKKILDKKIRTEAETRLLVKKLYEDYLSQDDNFTIFFEGGLGAGKTFIVRDILRNFGVADEVTSPTYIYVNEYADENKNSYAHFDLYRLESNDDFFARGFDEIVVDTSVSKFVEWPGKISRDIQQAFSGIKYKIEISYGTGDTTRNISVYRDE